MKSPEIENQVAIIGGGASGALMALHLAKILPGSELISIFEPRTFLGRGVAYEQNDLEDLTNTPVERMSVDPNSPLDLENWISEGYPEIKMSRHWPFIPRSMFAEYLSARMPRNLKHFPVKVIEIRKSSLGFKLFLSDGRQKDFKFVVLATGYNSKTSQIDFNSLTGEILILGSGLTAIDYWRKLRSQSKTRLHFLSRRGLLPEPHKSQNHVIVKSKININISPLQLLKEFRTSKSPEAFIELIRAQASQIWNFWSSSQKKSFLAHLKPYWEVMRHRMPASVYQELIKDFSDERVSLTAGRILSLTKRGAQTAVQIQDRKMGNAKTFLFDHVLDATGHSIDQSLSFCPEMKVEKCPFGFGYIQKQISNFWILGPSSKAQGWETTSIPDISAVAFEISKKIEAITKDSRRPDLSFD